MPSLSLESIHGWTTSGLACYHLPWTEHTIQQRRTRHARMDLGQLTRSDDIWHCIPSSPLRITDGRTMLGVTCHYFYWTKNSVRGRRAWNSIIALGSTDGQRMSGIKCHHRPWAAQTVRQCRALYAIISLGKHSRSDYVGRGMPSLPLGCTHG